MKKGTIKLGTVHLKSNKTIDGRGRDITIEGSLRIDAGVHDIIISDVRMTNPNGDDVLTIGGDVTESPSQLSTKNFFFTTSSCSRPKTGCSTSSTRRRT